MLAIETIKLMMFFVKLPNAIFMLLLAFKIKRLSNYVLNHILFLAFAGWSVFIATDGVLFIIAALGKTEFQVANVLRDVGVLMATLIPLCFIYSGFIIKEGEEIALRGKKVRLFTSLLICFGLAITIILNDSILVIDKLTKTIVLPDNLPPPVDTFSVNFDMMTANGQFSFYLYLSLVAWYFIGIFILFSVRQREKHELRKRLDLLMWSTMMIPFGILYFVFLPFIPILGTIKPYFNIVGQVLWALSPVLAYLSLKITPRIGPVQEIEGQEPRA